MAIQVVLGDMCYPKAQALIIPGNTRGIMSRGRAAMVIKDGLSGISKEAKKKAKNNDIEVGGCFSTSSGRLKRRGLKKLYHAVIRRLQSDFTTIYYLRNALDASFKTAISENVESVAVCGIGIEPGGLDKKVVARITSEICKKYADRIEIKIIDFDEVFINEVNSVLRKE